MSSVRRLYDAFRSSDGRIRIATLLGVSGLVMALAIFLMLPASAGEGDPSGKGVQPTEVSYGGGSGACAVFTDAAHELHINNPMDGSFTDPATGLQVTLDVDSNDFFFSFNLDNKPEFVVSQVIVNGGAKNTLFDYETSAVGQVRDDFDLHAPTKGGSSNLYNLSHVNICYDLAPPVSVSGVKYHDNDTDGTLDASGEDLLGGWKMAAFDGQGTEFATTLTAADGSYSFNNLPAGAYTICEETRTSGLPANGANYTWSWDQSEPLNNSLCTGFAGYEPAGYAVIGDLTGADFGNHFRVSIDCSGEGVAVPLGDEGEPQSIVTIPGECASDIFTSSYDVGLSDDGDEWRQFVVFGGDPNGAETIEQVIEWVPEPADYQDGSLVVPTTQVRLSPGANLQPVVFCSSLTPPGEPNSTTSQCQVSRTISEGEPLNPGEIQLTEVYKFLGDPPNFR